MAFHEVIGAVVTSIAASHLGWLSDAEISTGANVTIHFPSWLLIDFPPVCDASNRCCLWCCVINRILSKGWAQCSGRAAVKASKAVARRSNQSEGLTCSAYLQIVILVKSYFLSAINRFKLALKLDYFEIFKLIHRVCLEGGMREIRRRNWDFGLWFSADVTSSWVKEL